MERKLIPILFTGAVVRYADIAIAATTRRERYDIIDRILSSNFRAEDIRKLKMNSVDSNETLVSIYLRGGNMAMQMYIVCIEWTTHDS